MSQVAHAKPSRKLLELASSLERQPGFAEVAASLRAGHAAAIGGTWASSRALVARALVQNIARSHANSAKEHSNNKHEAKNGKQANQTSYTALLVVLPHSNALESFASDAALFGQTNTLCFPAIESSPNDKILFDEFACERQRVLKALLAATSPASNEPSSEKPLRKEPLLVVTSIQSLLQCTPTKQELLDSTRELTAGGSLDVDVLTAWLVEAGFRATTSVELPGEFAKRGGILDLFLFDEETPVRIELFGDEIESIRRFDVGTQRSLETISEIQVTALSQTTRSIGHFADFLPETSWVVLIEPEDIDREAKYFLERADRPQDAHSLRKVLARLFEFPSVTFSNIPSSSVEASCHLAIESVERFSGDMHRIANELDTTSGGDDVFLVCETKAEVERLTQLFQSSTTAQAGRLHFVLGRLEAGFRLVRENISIVSGAELFQRQDLARHTRRRFGRSIDSFLELRDGDLVIHLSHGIGRYRGLELIDKDGTIEEHLVIEFHGGTKIYVPSSKIELVQKYVGGTKTKPRLATVGNRSWIRKKQAAEIAVMDLASDLIDLQAAREARPGIAFPEDTAWQREFDASFPYQETPDQLTAIAAIKQDMLRQRPMDRLLCGDVGFGKTELALRAAFKAVDAGYQVAVLVPTTILAEQHGNTFRKRMAEFPFEIAVLSRFGTKKEQRETIKRLQEGSVDIVIGTHRLASPDVQFSNLGLLIIDEEQRFGVAIKERLKALRQTVDVLTMTATPIPRTLHFSLLGIRDIANLESPPEDRIAVETRVVRFDEALIRRAILRELNREGQVFFVHNRVHDIHKIEDKLKRIVPEASIAVGHGQMPEHELEEVMVSFINGEVDILLATTIIESGLDIPNANTIFIDDADRYGLAEMHQLRGRVGRYKHRAYCYLLIGENKHLSPQSAKRLRAIEEFSQMGAGFAISMRDLELRGAGNILGTQQSGHIATVGYELYCSLLENAVRQQKKMPPKETVDVHIDLPGEAYLPSSYIPDMRLKIDLYRRMSRLSKLKALAEFAAELKDRFGPIPPLVKRLLERTELRILAHKNGIRSLHLEDHFLVLGYTSRKKIESVVTASKGRLRVVDGESAYLPLKKTGITGEDILRAIKSVLRKSL